MMKRIFQKRKFVEVTERDTAESSIATTKRIRQERAKALPDCSIHKGISSLSKIIGQKWDQLKRASCSDLAASSDQRQGQLRRSCDAVNDVGKAKNVSKEIASALTASSRRRSYSDAYGGRKISLESDGADLKASLIGSTDSMSDRFEVEPSSKMMDELSKLEDNLKGLKLANSASKKISNSSEL